SGCSPLSHGSSYPRTMHKLVPIADSATPEIYPLSLHAALPILARRRSGGGQLRSCTQRGAAATGGQMTFLASIPIWGYFIILARSEEHTSELQSRENLVCRLLLEKRKSTPAQPLRKRALERPMF